MTKKPILNALAAFGYILSISFAMNWLSRQASHRPDTFLAPVLVVSLFTLSAAVMAYLFCYQPIQLYFDGHKKAAVSLFLKTTGAFAIITLCVLAAVLYL